MTHDKPRGKEEITRALVRSAVRLIAEQGVRNVSFRDIADAAGVQHSLITRHFGSKAELLRRVGEHLGQSLFASSESTESFEQVWDRVLREKRTELRALVRILLDTDAGDHASDLSVQKMHQTVDWFRSKLEARGPFDASLSVYLTMSFLMGSEVFGRHIQHIMGLSEAEFDDLRPRAVKALLDGLRQVTLTPL